MVSPLKRFSIDRDEDGNPTGPEALPYDHPSFFCDVCFGYHASINCPVDEDEDE